MRASPVSIRIGVPNLVAVQRSCQKGGGTDRQTDGQTDKGTLQLYIVEYQWTTRASGRKRLRFSGLSWVVTVTFQNIAACKLLFFVKNKGQWNAKSGPKVGDGKVAM